MLEFSSTESCTTGATSTPLVGFSSNDSSCDGNVALMNDFESTGGCSGQGPQGPDGFSAYQIAVFNGFVGTEEEWLASLVGPGVPVGGTAGQILAKINSTNFNTQWINNTDLVGLTSVGISLPTGLTVSNSPLVANGVLNVAYQSGYSIPTTASQTNWDTAYTNRISSLTTIGSNGSATLISKVLNIPTYTLSGLGGVATTTTITTTIPLTGGGDLSVNRILSIDLATSIQSGYLSSTDWNTFNSKFNLPSLTSGSVLFSDGTTVAQNNANFFWNNANNRLGIGTTTPSYALHVNGVTGSTTFTIPSYNSQLNQNYLMLYGGYGAGMQGTYNNPTGGDLTFGTFINSIFNEKMRLLPSGNFGIGTVSPSHKLELSSAGYTSLGIFSGANNIAEIVFQNTAYGLPRWTIRSSATPNGSSGSLTFQRLASTFPFTITNNDNVLIGTIVDNGGKLQIKAGGSAGTDIALRVRNSGDTGDLITIDGTGKLNFSTPTANTVSIQGSGNGDFFINSTAYGPMISSSGSNYTFNQWGTNVNFIVGTGGAPDRLGYNMTFKAGISTGNTNGGDFQFFSSGSGTAGSSALNTVTEVLRIKYNGNVGIGTTTPSAKLHIQSTQGTVSYYGVTGTNADQNRISQDYYTAVDTTPDFFGRTGYKFEGGTNTASRQYQIHVSDAATPKFVINGSGNVGIGTITPNTKAEVYGLETVNRTSYSDILTISAGANTNPYTGHGGGILFRATNYISGTTLVNSARIGSTITNNSVILTGADLFFDVSPLQDGVLSRAMTIKYNGAIGIGTTTPQQILDVYSTSNYQGILVRGSVAPSIGFVRNAGTASEWKIGISGNFGSNLAISSGTVATDVMTFGASGVGIGVTNATSKLDILDTVLAGSAALAGSVLNISQTWNTTGVPTAIKLNVTDTLSGAGSLLLDLQVGASSKFYVRNDGVVSVSNEIRNGNMTQTTSGLRYGNTASFMQLGGASGAGSFANSGSAEIDLYGITNVTNPGAIIFKTGVLSVSNQPEVARITPTGNLGIGNNAPTARLQVKGDGTNTIAIFETSAGALALSVNNSGSGFGFGSGGINLITTNDGTTNVNTGTGLIYKANVSTSNTTIYSHYFSNNNIRQAISGTIGLVDYSSSFSAGAGSANFRPLNIGYTLNNTGAQTGTATGIFLNATETALNGMVHNLMDLQVGSVSKFKIASTGDVTIGGITLGSNSTVYALNIAASNFTTTSNNATLTLNPRIFDGSPGNARTAVAVTPTTISHSSGLWNTFAINSTYTQSGTASSTDLLINRTETSIGSGTQLLLDAQVGGVSKFSVRNDGRLNASGSIISLGDVVTGAPSYLGFTGRTVFSSPSNGVLLVTNNAVTDFSRLQLGGTTNLFPSIKRNGTAIHFRLADDSAFCNIKAANLEASIILNNLYYDATGTLAWLLVSSTTAECNFKRSSLFSPSTGTAVASAQVQIDSTTKGFLPPRMTNAERLAILTPAVGLMVYCTDVVEGVYVNKSTGWTFMA